MASTAQRRLARTISDVGGTDIPFTRRIYTTVATVTAGASLDGLAAATVAINTDNIPAPYNANYTPTVGDHVAVDLVGGSPVIAFKVAGFPNI